MESEPLLRPSLPGETSQLVGIASGTHVFKPLELVALAEVFDDYFRANHALGHRSVTCERAGEPVGFAYYAPAAMTDRTWYLYWIAVSKQSQARGVGGILLRQAEDEIRGAGGRLLLIETSSLPHYELTRRFYLKHDYELHARIRDFYADGDDLVLFRKRLAAERENT